MVKMKMYLLPVILQMIYFPIAVSGLNTFVSDNIIINIITFGIDYGAFLSIIVCFISPIYLIGMYIYHKDWRNRGVLKPHIYMAICICLSQFISYLGWSELDMEKFMNPDGMTRAFAEGAVRNGLYLIGISLIVSLIIKLFYVIKRYVIRER